MSDNSKEKLPFTARNLEQNLGHLLDQYLLSVIRLKASGSSGIATQMCRDRLLEKDRQVDPQRDRD